MHNRPLIVDLDGTLIKTDMLFEGILVLLKKNILYFFVIFYWALYGKQTLKYKLAEIVTPNIDKLPKNIDFINFLKKQKKEGRKLVLATASTVKYANLYSEHLNLFDEILASDEKTNLKGKKKLEIIKETYSDFDYAGDSMADEVIFSHATEFHLVNSNKKLIKKLQHKSNITVWGCSASSISDWITQLRIYQWIKNVLLFVPLFVTHQHINTDSAISTFLGFISFSVIASSTYILNDMIDINTDRNHPRKCNRPLASGKISIKHGIFGGAVLFLLGITISATISSNFLLIICTYLATTLAYTFHLKTYVLIDTIILAGLYTLRIIAGAILIKVELSFWLLAFSMFTFFSLALVKRCSEIHFVATEGKLSTKGRDYNTSDYDLLQSFGASSSLMSLLMLMFYIEDSFQQNFYNEPQLLWLILPAFAYFFMRIWLKTTRSEMHDDPIVFALKDKGTLITVLFIIITTLAARLL